MSKWTKAPWRADIRSGCAGVKDSHTKTDCPGMGHDYPENLVCYTKRGAKPVEDPYPHWRIPEETVANMHLISAAPEMYNVMQALIAVSLGLATQYVANKNEIVFEMDIEGEAKTITLNELFDYAQKVIEKANGVNYEYGWC